MTNQTTNISVFYAMESNSQLMEAVFVRDGQRDEMTNPVRAIYSIIDPATVTTIVRTSDDNALWQHTTQLYTTPRRDRRFNTAATMSTSQTKYLLNAAAQLFMLVCACLVASASNVTGRIFLFFKLWCVWLWYSICNIRYKLYAFLSQYVRCLVDWKQFIELYVLYIALKLVCSS